MKILLVFDGDYPWDVRVEKMAAAFLDAGHAVRVLCRNRARRPHRERLPDGLEIARLPALRNSLTFPAFINPIWAWYVIQEVRSFQPDRLLVRDLPLGPLVAAVGRCVGIPVIADLAEPYPDSLRSLFRFNRMSLVDRVVRNPQLADYAERLMMRLVDRVLVVCPEAGRRLERRGLSPGRWTEVGNTVTSQQFLPRYEPVPELAGLENRIVLLFSGLLLGDRGIDVALKAVALLRDRHPKRFAFVIVGAEGPPLLHRRSSLRVDLEAEAARLGLGGDVRFTGWIDHGRLPDVIARADIGLLPFRACDHINSTLANKLFEYMSQGLPVIASDAPPMVRVLTETGAGLLFRSGDPADLAAKIELMAEGAELRRRCGEAGRRAVSATYNWNTDKQRLLRVVDVPAGS